MENLNKLFEAEIKFIEHYEKRIDTREKNNYAECNTGSKFGINSWNNLCMLKILTRPWNMCSIMGFPA